ncbi:phage BR0599 family protein [Wolbachia endosymbiont (group B) of Ennomos erosarius]
MPFLFSFNPEFAFAGCNKTFPTCRSKFNNTVNFRGEPYIPGFYIV